MSGFMELHIEFRALKCELEVLRDGLRDIQRVVSLQSADLTADDLFAQLLEVRKICLQALSYNPDALTDETPDIALPPPPVPQPMSRTALLDECEAEQ